MIKKIISALIIIAIIFGLYKLLSIPPQNNNYYDNPDLTFYWGNGCPHCENVKSYIKNNNIDQKLKINQKEVYKDANNQKELLDIVSQFCPEIDKTKIGVPLGFDPVSKKCIQGDQSIIDFLSSK